MPNGIQHTTGSTPTGCLRKGNILIANNLIEYGTSFFSGITPPSGGYSLYLNKASGGPSIYCPSNDAQLIDITNKNIAGTVGSPAGYTTVAQCLEYFAGQTDKLATNFDYENIITDGLVLNLDAGFVGSYPTTASTWYDISGNDKNSTLTNGPTFNSANSGSIVFDGVDDYVLTPSLLNASLNPTESVFVWFNPAAAGQIVSELGQATIDAGYHDSNIEVNSSGIFSFSVWHGSLTNKVVSSAKSFNNWYHLGFTYSGTTFTAYINGSSIGTATFTRQPPSSLHYGLCSIDSTNMGTGAYGSGKMGNFMFYNRALSATEVLQNYNAQKGRYGL